MPFEQEQLNSGATEETSPESQNTAAQNEGNNTAEGGEGQAEQTTKTQDTTPFHEHPRFKEIIEEKNRFAEQLKAYERRFQELEQRSQQSNESKTKEDKLLARLKEIDPEFGGRFEEMYAKVQQVDQLAQWKQAQEVQSTQQAAQTQLDTLYTKNNIPEDLRDMYRANIVDLARSSGAKVGDLPKLFEQVHGRFNKYLEGVRRTDRESYVTGKKTDSKAPAPAPRGPAPKANTQKSEWSKNPDEMRQQLVSKVLKNLRSDAE